MSFRRNRLLDDTEIRSGGAVSGAASQFIGRRLTIM